MTNILHKISPKTKRIIAAVLSLVLVLGAVSFIAPVEAQALSINASDSGFYNVAYGPENENYEEPTTFGTGAKIRVLNQTLIAKNKGKSDAVYTLGTDGWTTDGSLVWDGTGENTIYGVYPYNASYDEFTIPTDQSGGVQDADWMTATYTGAETNSVDLNFSHLLTMVTVRITTWNTEFQDLNKVIDNPSIYTKGTALTVSYGTGENVYSSDGTLTAIAPMVSGETFTAIVAPVKYAEDNEFMTFTVDGQALTVLAKADELKNGLQPGYHYTFNLTVGKEAVTLTSVNVTDWAQENIAGGVAEEALSIKIDGSTATIRPDYVSDVMIKEAMSRMSEYGWSSLTEIIINGSNYSVVNLASQTAGGTVSISKNSVIFGDNSEHNLSLNIADDATVIFGVGTSGVKLGGSITVADGKTLTLLATGNAEHTVKGGISLGNGSNVIIEGDLTQENNKLTVTSSGGNAGIGANNGVTAGDITIRNARVDATGSGSSSGSSSISGAAIGTANAKMGDILIENSIVTAAGGYYDDYENMSHAAAIGMGSYGGVVGNITLKDSEITASNNGEVGCASVIGAGDHYVENGSSVTGALGDITITNTDLNLSMSDNGPNAYGAMIGTGTGYLAIINMGKITFTDMTKAELDAMIGTWSIPSDFAGYAGEIIGASQRFEGSIEGVYVIDDNGDTVKIDDGKSYNP